MLGAHERGQVEGTGRAQPVVDGEAQLPRVLAAVDDGQHVALGADALRKLFVVDGG